MLHAYRLIYLESPYAPPKLWKWEQPYIHHLIVNARSFKTTRVEQRYFQGGDDLARENTRIWEEHYRCRPLYDRELPTGTRESRFLMAYSHPY
jgi:hypothetical protein